MKTQQNDLENWGVRVVARARSRSREGCKLKVGVVIRLV
jgi:hypothetical protein